MDLRSSAHGVNSANKLHKAATVRGVLQGMMMNAVSAYILFLVCKNILLTSDLVAVLLSGMPAAISTLVSVVRQRRLDLFGALTLIVIALGMIVPLLSGYPRLYFLRHSLITILLGVAYLVSLFFPKPLWFYIGRYFLTGNDPYNMALLLVLIQPIAGTVFWLVLLGWTAWYLRRIMQRLGEIKKEEEAAALQAS